MTSRLAATVCALVCVVTSSAGAEAWYQGPHGKNRVIHLSTTVAGGTLFVLSEAVFKADLAPDTCRWCDPPGFDDSIRNALVWDDVHAARTWPNVTGYVAAPALALGATLLGVREDPGWARLIDDTVPILETVAISQVFTQAVKFSVGRQRPLAHYPNPPPPAESDDNLSFFSGHTALAFGAVTSAGMVAHWRDSALEPVIWGAGMTLSVATAYLRIAGDKHYFSDVVVGALVGVGSGLTIPRLMRRDSELTIVSDGKTVSVAGPF